MDEKNQISHIISQFSVINLLAQHHKEFESIFQLTIEETGLGLRQIISCESDTSALEAYQTMSQKMSSIPIVQSNSIISILSVRDLKLLFVEHSLDVLSLSAEEFVGRVRRLNFESEGFPYIVVTKESTIEKALFKLVATKVQRVFIIDENKRPIGVITLRDIIKYVVDSLTQ